MPNPTAGLHIHHTQHTHKTLLTAAAQPALSHDVSQRHSLGQTPMPAKPRTPLGSSLNPACNKHTPTQKPSEVSCAPRSAPEPDSQSPKNKHTELSQPRQHPYRHASNPRALQKPTPAYPISHAAAQPRRAKRRQGSNSLLHDDEQPTPARQSQHPTSQSLVEADGIEPTTPCLQSRCSPS